MKITHSEQIRLLVRAAWADAQKQLRGRELGPMSFPVLAEASSEYGVIIIGVSYRAPGVEA